MAAWGERMAAAPEDFIGCLLAVVDLYSPNNATMLVG
jgi:hypothetical protein